MAYDEFMAERISRFFDSKGSDYYAKKMFGGLCFMVEDKMCCAILHNKKKDTDFLMARIGEDAIADALAKNDSVDMDIVERPMKGYVFVIPDGYDTDEDLEYWLSLCLEFNPLAKKSKKRKKKEQ